jgi:hypothetical protein
MLKEWSLTDGRKVLLDRRTIGFAAQSKDDPSVTIVGCRISGAKPVPVKATYADIVAWLGNFVQRSM